MNRRTMNNAFKARYMNRVQARPTVGDRYRMDTNAGPFYYTVTAADEGPNGVVLQPAADVMSKPIPMDFAGFAVHVRAGSLVKV